MIQSYRDLEVWRKAMDLVLRVYEATGKFPHSETFGLVSQLRRAATSIPSNIAEGKAIGGLNYPRHLRIAHGSGDAEADALLSNASEVGRMLVGLQRSLPKE